MDSLVTGLFFLVTLLNQQWFPPLRLQASHCSTFRIMCDVPSIVAFCSESIECFPGTASIFFLKLLVTIPVVPIITGIIVHFRGKMDAQDMTLEDITRKLLIWYGHAERMDPTRLPKIMIHWKPEGRKKRGRPRRTWKDGIYTAMNEKDLRTGEWNNRRQ